MLNGRWLQPDDHYAIVVSTGILKNEPDIQVGDDVVFKIKASYADITHVTEEFGQVSSLMVVTDRHDEQAQIQAAPIAYIQALI